MQAKDLWNMALEPGTYIDLMTQNQETFRSGIEATELTDEELERFSEQGLRLLILTEDYCGDSAQFIPPLIRLAQDLASVTVRILVQHEHADFAELYPHARGFHATPIIIALDEAGNELGYLVERPQRVDLAMAAETRRFALENQHLNGVRRNYDRMPEATRALVKAHIDAWRATQTAEWTRWLLEDLSAITQDVVVRLPT